MLPQPPSRPSEPTSAAAEVEPLGHHATACPPTKQDDEPTAQCCHPRGRLRRGSATPDSARHLRWTFQEVEDDQHDGV